MRLIGNPIYVRNFFTKIIVSIILLSSTLNLFQQFEDYSANLSLLDSVHEMRLLSKSKLTLKVNKATNNLSVEFDTLRVGCYHGDKETICETIATMGNKARRVQQICSKLFKKIWKFDYFFLFNFVNKSFCNSSEIFEIENAFSET